MAGFLCNEGLPNVLDNGLTGDYIVHLMDASSVVNQDSVLADFVEASFPGYSAVDSLTFNMAFGGSFSNATAAGMMYADFREDADASVPASVIGYYVEQSDGTCLGAETFDTPVMFQFLGDAVRIQIVVSFGPCINCP